MDIQRTLLWVVFVTSLLFLWDGWQRSQGHSSLLGGPSQTQKPAAAAPTPPPVAAGDVPAPAAKAAAELPPGGVPAPAGAALPAPAVAAAAEPRSADAVRVRTDLFQIDIDPKGAALVRAELLQQFASPDWTAQGLLGLVTGSKPQPQQNVVLLEWTPGRVYLARSGLTGADGTRLPNHLTAFTAQPGPRELAPGADSLEVSFTAEAGGVRLTKVYVFRRGRYDVEVRHEVENLGAEPVKPSVYLQILRDGNKPLGESALYSTFTGPAVYTDAQKFQKVAFGDVGGKKAVHATEAKEGWIAMIQHYFVTAWVPPQGAYRELRTAQDSPNLYSVSSVMPLEAVAPGARTVSQAALWIGPQDQDRLEKLSPGLDLVVDYGYLSLIAKPLFQLLNFLHGLVGNWGWAIVLATCLIKLAFYPLSAASYKSMARMKEVTPRMMKIREQYGDDKQKMNVAMMELYRKEKINPLGGCLPILVQIPVFIAYYWVILASVEMRNSPWIGWVHDLTTPDPWLILPVIMVATMWIQYKLNPTPPDPVQAKVMAAMPFIFGVMFFFFPSGLVLYWLVNNVLSIAQQWYITRQISQAKPVG